MRFSNIVARLTTAWPERRLRAAVAAVGLALGLVGCRLDGVAELAPSGLISRGTMGLFWTTIALMALVIVPVFVMTAWLIVKYRAANNGGAPHPPAGHYPDWLEWLLWLFPTVIIAILASITWVHTHRLDPYQPLASPLPPLEIQAVALDWQWLFIYPEQGVAAVNELALPVNRPIAFTITSNTVMNAFFIPRLAGQIFAMPGMTTRLHLIADQPGRYFGENIQFSGQGFPDQRFDVNVLSTADFNSWIAKAKQSPRRLNPGQFEQLARPSVKQPIIYYAAVAPGLFKHILARFNGAPLPSH